MKKILATILVSLIMVLGFSSFTEAAVRVKGYYKPSSGTRVESHYRTSPNKTKFDNWSTKGNINPYTGKKGTASPFKSFRLK